MPFITLTLLKGRPAAEKKQILDAVHASLIDAGVPATDRFQRVIELEPENFIYDATYPDLATPRTDKFMVIEIMLSVGRSVKIKRKLLTHLMDGLTALDLSPNDAMVVFKETAWENWAFANGNILHT